MSSTKGGQGLHGPDKRQDALREVRAYDNGGPSRAPHPSEGHRTEHQRAADARQGVPDTEKVHPEESDLPEGLSRRRMGPLDKNTGRGDE